MSFLVALAAFFQQFGMYTMIAAWIAFFATRHFMSRRKYTTAGWAAVVTMVLSGILAFSQLVLGAYFGNVTLLIFGGICVIPVVYSWKTARDVGLWYRFRRRPKPPKGPKPPRRPWMN